MEWFRLVKFIVNSYKLNKKFIFFFFVIVYDLKFMGIIVYLNKVEVIYDFEVNSWILCRLSYGMFLCK